MKNLSQQSTHFVHTTFLIGQRHVKYEISSYDYNTGTNLTITNNKTLEINKNFDNKVCNFSKQNPIKTSSITQIA